MVKIIQFGEGNFLRAFVDTYFDTLNKEGLGEYQVNIVKPVVFGTLDKFTEQKNKYHTVLRGYKNGKAVEEIYAIDSLASVIDPFHDYDQYIALATDKDLKLLVSNTTEAGIVYNGNDEINGFENITYPGKLTKFLYTRYKAGLPGIYLLPVELIDHNAETLYECVDRYITLWNLGEDFRKWNNEQNYYCNTLVDRIVSGFPKDEATKAHLNELIGQTDNLMTIGEPFGLWVVQNKGNLKDYIREGTHNIDVILTPDITYYKKRKVRVLNGSHTNLVPISLWMGKVTVYDVMTDPVLSQFVANTLKEDINPFVSDDLKKTEAFSDQVSSRFLNPFLNHQLTSIALNSISKWKARDLPSFVDYYTKNKKIPTYLTIGFAYLVNLYQRIYQDGAVYKVDLPSRTIEIKDDLSNLVYFHNGKSVHDFMSDVSLWGMDLTSFNGFEDKVNEYLTRISKGENIL